VAATAACTCLVLKAFGTPCFFLPTPKSNSNCII
jgi:hypothetical protein